VGASLILAQEYKKVALFPGGCLSRLHELFTLEKYQAFLKCPLQKF
jgi:hypothetical protein